MKQELTIPDLMQVFDALHDSMYTDSTRANVRNGVYSAVKRPEYVGELCTAAKSGGVFSRYVAISALDDLSGVDICAAEAKAGVLDCAGDSSKQIQELLLCLGAHAFSLSGGNNDRCAFFFFYRCHRCSPSLRCGTAFKSHPCRVPFLYS